MIRTICASRSVLAHIVSFLPLREHLCVAACTSRSFKAAAESSWSWSRKSVTFQRVNLAESIQRRLVFRQGFCASHVTIGARCPLTDLTTVLSHRSTTSLALRLSVYIPGLSPDFGALGEQTNIKHLDADVSFLCDSQVVLRLLSVVPNLVSLELRVLYSFGFGYGFLGDRDPLRRGDRDRELLRERLERVQRVALHVKENPIRAESIFAYSRVLVRLSADDPIHIDQRSLLDALLACPMLADLSIELPVDADLWADTARLPLGSLRIDLSKACAPLVDFFARDGLATLLARAPVVHLWFDNCVFRSLLHYFPGPLAACRSVVISHCLFFEQDVEPVQHLLKRLPRNVHWRLGVNLFIDFAVQAKIQCLFAVGPSGS